MSVGFARKRAPARPDLGAPVGAIRVGTIRNTRRNLLFGAALWPLSRPATAQVSATTQVSATLPEVPFVPTPMNVVWNMLDMASVGRNDHLIDLGCGDGRIVTEAARRGASAHGVDLDAVLIALCRRRARDLGLEARATFAQQDIFETDLRPASVVTLYLLPEDNLKLRDKLTRELAPGSRVVSHDWPMGDWVPDARLTLSTPDKQVGGDGRSRIYMWVMPPRGGGR